LAGNTDEQITFVLEIVIDRTFGDARFTREVGNRRALEPFRGEDFGRGIQNLFAALFCQRAPGASTDLGHVSAFNE
jgi:hypothetical protein